MYWLERYMKVMKDDVRQKARPEGSMAEGHRLREAMFLCSNILEQLHPQSAFMLRDREDTHLTSLRLIDQGAKKRLRARRGRPFRFPTLREYMQEKLRQVQAQDESMRHYPPITSDIKVLVRGPTENATTYNQYWHKARHFRVRALDEKKTRTADSGLSATFWQECRASGHDRNVVVV
ncbi:hypothetical protein R1sor_021281 [Riccia sorocarpa]|uniref:DUF4218 domain-containing protein n=1 Tax=Riccia sorocarpa TaxID=122646 RepID=A0ABD3GK02_9MARC